LRWKACWLGALINAQIIVWLEFSEIATVESE
jgi:hypothetical protein